MTHCEFVPNQTIIVEPYPFYVVEVSLPPDDPESNQLVLTDSWCPGHYYEPNYNQYDDGGYPACNGYGKQILRIVDIHKPGKYPTRVFYTREWEDPDGKRFGKTGQLRIAVTWRFRQLADGYGVGNDEDFPKLIPKSLTKISA